MPSQKKNYSLENKMWRQTSGWVTCAKPSRRNPDPSVSHFLISLPFLHDFDVKSVILRFKVRKKRATKSMQLVLQHCYKASRKEMFRVLQPTSNLSCNKSSLNDGGKTRNIALRLVLQQCCQTSYMFFVARFTESLWRTKTSNEEILILYMWTWIWSLGI